MNIRKSYIVLACFFLFLLSGCNHHLGYSVLLWNLDDRNIADGTILNVYIRSDLSQVYVVSLPNEKEKFEVPLWQITAPESRKKAEERAKLYTGYEHTYARVTYDGLPMRTEPDNVAKQKYRLRENEIIRVLYKGNGVAPRTGDKIIEGDWLHVLAHDGTSGWCFSRNLSLFTMAPGESLSTNNNEDAPVAQTEDSVLSDMLNKRWYPQSYADMIEKKVIDISKMSASGGFDTGVKTGTIKLRDEDVNVTFPYIGISKTARNTYKYDGCPIIVTVRGNSEIVVQYTDDSGKPKSYHMVSLKDDVENVVNAEINRRAKLYSSIVTNSSEYKSSNYGLLKFDAAGKFTWKKYNKLVPSLIDKGAKGNGSVEIKYLLSSSLKSSWDGVLTFHFEGMSKEVNFLYKMESNGLKMEDAERASFDGNIITNRSSNPMVLFFAK